MGSYILWKADVDIGSVTMRGDVSSQSQQVAVAPASKTQERTYTFNVGIDANRNGILDTSEVLKDVDAVVYPDSGNSVDGWHPVGDEPSLPWASKFGDKVLWESAMAYNVYKITQWVLDWEVIDASALQTAYPGASLNGGWTVENGEQDSWTLQAGGAYAISDNLTIEVSLRACMKTSD